MSGPDTPVFAGVDIGGTTTQVVLCDAELKVLDRTEVATPARSGGRPRTTSVGPRRSSAGS